MMPLAVQAAWARRALTVAAVGLVALVGSVTSSSASDATTATEPAPPSVPHPFGKLSCSPDFGVRFCPGGMTVGGPDLRIPSFDGVPLDADLTLPASGKGPFPLIVLLHGLGGSKAVWEIDHRDTSPRDENNVALASNGWAVLTYSARGFGNSCGAAASRDGTPACADGWERLADQRYEVRDTQYLAGELVDEGLVLPRIAASGVSYGGGQSLDLAMLKNRIRLPDGSVAPWVSPARHVPLSIGGMFAQWAWDDLADALDPNGHLSTVANSPASDDVVPVGVPKLSWNTLLYGVSASGYLANPGADLSSDLTNWYHATLKGEPVGSTDRQALASLQRLKSAIGIPMPTGGPAPTAILNGWNDSLFPTSEATHYTDRVAAAGDHVPMLVMMGDVGHGWAQNKPDVTRATIAEGLTFLDATVRHTTRVPTGVVTYATTCPAKAPSGRSLAGPSLRALATRVPPSGRGEEPTGDLLRRRPGDRICPQPGLCRSSVL